MVCKDSPGSLLGSRKNFGVELKIELNLWEDHLRKKQKTKKKTRVNIPARFQFSLS